MTKASKYGYMHNAKVTYLRIYMFYYKKDSMMFTFTHILDQNTNQGEVFDTVAKPVVLKFANID